MRLSPELEARLEELIARLAYLASPPAPQYRGSFSKIWHGTGPGIHLTGECNQTKGEIRDAT